MIPLLDNTLRHYEKRVIAKKKLYDTQLLKKEYRARGLEETPAHGSVT
jgi:hypothetical protein